jgi:hypothetical protein
MSLRDASRGILQFCRASTDELVIVKMASMTCTLPLQAIFTDVMK